MMFIDTIKKIFHILIALLLLIRINLLPVYADDCKDVLVIFARGSAQNQDIDYVGENDQRLTREFFAEIKARKPENVSWNATSLEYPASGGIPNYIGAEFNLSGPIGGGFAPSVRTGVSSAKSLIESEFNRCPTQKVILGGYSQGANVIGDTLFQLNEAAANNVVYVALFGDPKFKADSYAARGSFIRRGGGILEARQQEFPESFRGKLHSWCKQGDGICENRFLKELTGTSTHHTYIDFEVSLAANEAALRLQQYYPDFAPKQVDITQLDTTKPVDVVFVADWSIQQTGVGNSSWRHFFSETTLPALRQMSGDIRVGLTRFWNSNIGGGLNSILLTDTDSFISGLEPLNNPSGGSGNPDGIFTGVNLALNGQPWRDEAQKYIILMPRGNYVDPEPTLDGGSLTLAGSVANAQDKNVTIHTVLNTISINPIPDSSLAKRDAFSLLSTPTGGKTSFYLNSHGTMLGVPAMLESIAGEPFRFTSPGYNVRLNKPILISAAAGFDPNSSLVSYEWDLDGDGTFELTTDSPVITHTFTAPFNGTGQVKMVSHDGDEVIVDLPIDAGDHNPLRGIPGAVRNLVANIIGLFSSQQMALTDSNETYNVQLSWQEPADTGGYEIESYVIKNQAGEVLGIVDSDTLSVEIEDVPLGTQFSVQAVNEEGVGIEASETVEEESEESGSDSADDDEVSKTSDVNKPSNSLAPRQASSRFPNYELDQNSSEQATSVGSAVEESKVKIFDDGIARIPSVGAYDWWRKWWIATAVLGLPAIMFAQNHRRKKRQKLLL